MAAYLDIIILLVVVVLVFSKLKSLLGTQIGRAGPVPIILNNARFRTKTPQRFLT